MRYKHTIVIGIDGMGNYNRNAETPNIDQLFRNGAVTFEALSMDPTISAENWGSMLIGCDPGVHQLTNSIISRRPYLNKELPTVFSRIRKEYPDAHLISCVNWSPINRGIIEQDVGADLRTADNDEDLCAEIEKAIAEKPDFLFIQFDDVDSAGHGNWYGTEPYLKQIETTDTYVGRIAKACRQAGIFDETLFICLADHGGIRGGHGGYTPEEKKVFFGVAGPGISNSPIEYAQTKDVAAIVLYAFGIAVPSFDRNAFSSQVPDHIFAERADDYRRPNPVPNLIETRTTPAFDGENGLLRFFDKNRIKLALFFDDEIKDETGKNRFTEYGTVKYYSTGVYGARAEFGSTGYISTDDLKFGNKSFTAAFWIRLDSSLDEEVCVFGTQDWFWRRRDSRGFTQVFRNGDTRFSIGNGNDRLEPAAPYHDDVSEGWLHNISVVDKEAGELRIYHNFVLTRTCVIDPEFLCDMDTLPFTVGNDAAHQHNDKEFNFIFNMDDLLIFDGAFTDKDVETLKKYYG